MALTAKDIRNVAVIGHSGDGKTTLCEAMLFNGGSTDRMGKTADGTSVCDFDDLEKQKKMSVYTAMAFLNWNGVRINLLDTPGFYDFEGERYEGIAASEAAVLVVDSMGDIAADDEGLVEYCQSLGKPVIIFVNGMDKENANYEATVNSITSKIGSKAASIQIPIMEGGKMTGYVNAIQEKAYRFGAKAPEEIPVPEGLKGELSDMRATLMENAAENDEELLDKYFESGSLDSDEMLKGIRLGILSCSTIPILAGSALSNQGVVNLMDEITAYLPAASDAKPAGAADLDSGERVEVRCEDDGPFAGLVFKTVYDPYSGKLNYIKVLRGKLKSGTVVLNSNTGKEERIGQIYSVKGKKTEMVTELTAGDVGAVNKLSETNTNDTLCAQGTNIRLDPIDFPKPNLSMAVTCANKQDEDKMFAGFKKVMEEDYCFSVEKNVETNEMVVNGQGEVQLDLIAKKVKSRYGIEPVMDEPRIPYRETIRKTAEAEGKYKKQSGGHGQFGVVEVRFEPTEDEFEFAEEVVGGAVPKQYFPAVEKGLRECMAKGVLAGYPVTGVKATLYDGKFHPVDSSEMAFKAAANLAFKEGVKNAGPVLLEPIVQLNIDVPSEYLGTVMGDISKRRGRILGTEAEGKNTRLTAEAPMAEVTKYATDLRSFTQGRGRFTSEFVRYEEVPPQFKDKIIADAQVDKE